MDVTECGTCGVAVMSADKHKQWHQEVDKAIDQLELQVDDVERKADESASILYNRGLD